QVASALEGIRARARAIVVDVGTDQPPPNLAVTRLALAPDLPVATTGGLCTFLATVQNYGPATPAAVRVQLRAGRLPPRPGEPPFELRDAMPRQLRLERGQNIVSFPYKFTSPGEYVVQVRLEGDALDLDDARAVVVQVRETVPVLLVNGKPA